MHRRNFLIAGAMRRRMATVIVITGLTTLMAFAHLTGACRQCTVRTQSLNESQRTRAM
jgi:hypothetical protein